MAIAAIAAMSTAQPAAACDMMEYERIEVTPRVVVFQAAEGTTAVVNGNIVAVMGDAATLVVDTGQFPSIARRVVAELRARRAPLVRWIVNTHWHGDHLLGNGVFREAWPGAKIAAHPHTIREGARYYTNYPDRARKQIPAAVESMRKRRAATGSDEERLWIDRTLDCAERLVPEIDGTHYVAPDTPVEEVLRVDLGGVAAEIRHLGSANTPGDLVVWVPQERVVAVGDMLVAPVPYAIGSPLAPWPGTLARVQALRPAVIVPGHGPPMRDDAYLRDVAALIGRTHEQLAAFVAAGTPREEAERRLDTAAFRERHATTPMRRQAFEQFFVKPALAGAYRAAPAKAQ